MTIRFLFLAMVSFILFSCMEKTELTTVPKLEEKMYPYEQFLAQRFYPDKKPDIKGVQQAMTMARSMAASRNSEGSWVTQGPGNIGGRINTIAVSESAETTYLGYSQGGIFRQIAGGNWESIFDNQSYLAISDIEVDPHDNEVIYAGTGDLNISINPFAGDGIYKSLDGGETWENIGLQEASIISEINVSRQDSDVIYAGAMGIPFERNDDRGMYKSIDGGDTWSQILYVNDSTGVIDIKIHPDNHDIVYACTWNRVRNNDESLIEGVDAGIWKTVDGGDNWIRLEGGLPTGTQVRVGIEMSGSDPDVLFATYCNTGGGPCGSGSIDFSGLYKSLDGGDSWFMISEPGFDAGQIPCWAQGGFAWYFGRVIVDPSDDDHIFLPSVDLYETLDGGITWQSALDFGSPADLHVDLHDLVFTDDGFLLATDGGGYKYTKNSDVWEDIENNVTTQFYRVAYNPHATDLYFGGAQDNGTTSGNKQGVNSWDRIFGGDGFQAVFHPDDPDIFYVETQNGIIRVTTDGGMNFFSATSGLDGDRFWDMPYIMSSHNPDILITGSDKVFKSITGTDVMWEAISPVIVDEENPESSVNHNVSTISLSSVDEDIIYAGTNDGWAWVTTDGGLDWVKISDNLPRRYVSDIKASMDNAPTVFIAITGYRYNDFVPHIYKSDDYGDTWISIQGDLPPLAVNHIQLLKGYDDQVVFIATDAGVYYTINGGENWDRLGSNMPILPVYDLDYNVVHDQIIAGTFARGILTFDLSQIELMEPSLVGHLDRSFFVVYPTVTRDIISVSIDNSISLDNLGYKVTDIEGRTVLHLKKVKSDHFVISTEDLLTGTYFITLGNEKNQHLEKIIKI